MNLRYRVEARNTLGVFPQEQCKNTDKTRLQFSLFYNLLISQLLRRKDVEL